MIELTKASPGYDTLIFAFWIAIGIIGLLLLIVAHFLKRQNKIIDNLTKAVNGLNVTVGIIKNDNENRLPEISKQLDSHDKRLDEYGERITRVETKIEFNEKIQS
jgi:peptidoglycan hydrolase CwlO-like protein